MPRAPLISSIAFDGVKVKGEVEDFYANAIQAQSKIDKYFLDVDGIYKPKLSVFGTNEEVKVLLTKKNINKVALTSLGKRTFETPAAETELDGMSVWVLAGNRDSGFKAADENSIAWPKAQHPMFRPTFIGRICKIDGVFRLEKDPSINNGVSGEYLPIYTK